MAAAGTGRTRTESVRGGRGRGAHEKPPSDPWGRALLWLAALLVVHVAAHTAWLTLDHRPVAGAEADTMEVARAYYLTLRGEAGGEGALGRLLAVLDVPPRHAVGGDTPPHPAYVRPTVPAEVGAPVLPLAPLSGAAVARVYGYHPDAFTFANALWFAVLLGGVFWLAAQWVGPGRAVLATALVSLLPGLTAAARVFTPGLAATACLAWAVAALAASRGGLRTGFMLVAGGFAGLALLAREDAWLWLAVPLLATFVAGLVYILADRSEPDFNWGRLGVLALNLVVFGVLAAAVAAPYYARHAEALALETASGQPAASTSAVVALHPLLDHGLLLIPAALGVLGLLVAPLARGHAYPLVMLYAWAGGAIVMATALPHTALATWLPVLPALGVFVAALPVAVGQGVPRIAAALLVGGILLFQYGNHSVARYGALANWTWNTAADLAPPWLEEPLTLTLLRDELALAPGAATAGPPRQQELAGQLLGAVAEELRATGGEAPQPGPLHGEPVTRFALDHWQPAPNAFLPVGQTAQAAAPVPFGFPMPAAAEVGDRQYALLAVPARTVALADNTQAEFIDAGYRLLTRFAARGIDGAPAVYAVLVRSGETATTAGQPAPAATTSLIALHQQITRTPEAEVPDALRTRYAALLAEPPIGAAVSDELTLLDADIAPAGAGLYVVRLLLKSLAPLPGDFAVYLRGSVDDARLGQLPEADRAQGFTDWQLGGLPGVAPGAASPVLISHTIKAAPIAYAFSVGLFSVEDGYYGRNVELGEIDLGEL